MYDVYQWRTRRWSSLYICKCSKFDTAINVHIEPRFRVNANAPKMLEQFSNIRNTVMVNQYRWVSTITGEFMWGNDTIVRFWKVRYVISWVRCLLYHCLLPAAMLFCVTSSRIPREAVTLRSEVFKVTKDQTSKHSNFYNLKTCYGGWQKKCFY